MLLERIFVGVNLIIGVMGLAYAQGIPATLALFGGAVLMVVVVVGTALVLVWQVGSPFEIMSQATAVVLAIVPVGRIDFPGLQDADELFLRVMETRFPPLIRGIAVAAVLAAVMSTTDALLLACSSAIAHDMARPSTSWCIWASSTSAWRRWSSPSWPVPRPWSWGAVRTAGIQGDG